VVLTIVRRLPTFLLGVAPTNDGGATPIGVVFHCDYPFFPLPKSNKMLIDRLRGKLYTTGHAVSFKQ
jgi:hypothetical protein